MLNGSETEAADGAGAHVRRKPLHEIEENAGKNSASRHAEQKSHDVELQWRSDKHHADGNNSPGKHDAGQPFSRAEAEEQEVRGHFDRSIAKEEQPCAKAVDGGVKKCRS